MSELVREADRRQRPPAPAGISALAQQFLSVDAWADTDFPPLDDVEAWIAFVGAGERRLAERFAGFDPKVDTDELDVDGAHTFVVRPPEATADGPVYLDIHGGALIYGGGDLCRLMGSSVALGTGLTTWAVDYRMPPRHRFPAALDDCLAVYKRLLEQRSPQDVFVGGGSAGGNLAAALLLRAKDEGLPMPRALALLTPECDLTESGDSFRTNLGIDNVLGSLMPVNRLYADGHDLAHPYLSPLFGDLHGFPPTLLLTGTRDLFLSNTVRMHRALLAAGVEAELHVWEAMPHAGFGGTAPEDMEMRATLRRFLDRQRAA